VVANCSRDQLQFETPIEFYSSALEFDLLCDSRAYLAQMLSTVQFVGLIVGAFVFAPLADRYGRKPLATIVLVTGIVAIALSGWHLIIIINDCCVHLGLSPNWPIFYALRFVVGTACGGNVVIGTCLMELILPEQRLFLKTFVNWVCIRVVSSVLG
jgi:MFS family permease